MVFLSKAIVGFLDVGGGSIFVEAQNFIRVFGSKACRRYMERLNNAELALELSEGMSMVSHPPLHFAM